MKITQLETMEQVEAAVREALAMPVYPRKAEKARAARLADLFDMQAQLYREAGEQAPAETPEVYRAACFVAASSFESRSKQFRRTAGAR